MGDMKLVHLHEVPISEGREQFEFLFLPDEEILKAYRTIRDRLLVTNKRLISINVQGLTGSKVEYMVVPYSKVAAFSVETAGTFDLDGEMKIWISGVGLLEFEFSKRTNVGELARLLSRYIL